MKKMKLIFFSNLKYLFWSILASLLRTLKKHFLCNRTRNEHFAYLKQAAKSNYTEVNFACSFYNNYKFSVVQKMLCTPLTPSRLCCLGRKRPRRQFFSRSVEIGFTFDLFFVVIEKNLY
jgi:hypothetical protein